MSGILEALEKVAASQWNRFWQAPGWKEFVATGDPKHLKGLPKPASYESLPTELLQALGMPDNCGRARQASASGLPGGGS